MEIREYIEQAWGRFLDDCEIPMDEEKVQPEELHSILNSIHPKIQFTMQQSKEVVPFLDVLIRKEDNRIWIDLYTKATETTRYLPFSSAHPKHCKVNVPISFGKTHLHYIRKRTS